MMTGQNHHEGKYQGMEMVLTSRVDTPFAEKVGRISLKLLEVVPGVTFWILWSVKTGRVWISTRLEDNCL